MKDVRAKKYLGQHFLNDDRIACDITKLLSKKTKNVVEIGPGMGVLTKFLIKNDYTTQVVEIDSESVFYLRLNYPDLNVIEKDFLQINLKEEYPFNFLHVGNLYVLDSELDGRISIDEMIKFALFCNKELKNYQMTCLDSLIGGLLVY